MDTLYRLLGELDDAGIFYTLTRHRRDSVCVCITVPGQRVEVEIMADGLMEVSIFKGSEEILEGALIVSQIIDEFTD